MQNFNEYLYSLYAWLCVCIGLYSYNVCHQQNIKNKDKRSNCIKFRYGNMLVFTNYSLCFSTQINEPQSCFARLWLAPLSILRCDDLMAVAVCCMHVHVARRRRWLGCRLACSQYRTARALSTDRLSANYI